MEFLLAILLLAVSGIYDNYETVSGDTILLDEYPIDVVVGKNHKAYVLTSTSETFSILTIEDNKIVDNSKYNQDYGYPSYIQVDSDNQLLYVVNSKDPSLSVYHLDTKEFIQNINFNYCPNASINKFYLNQETNTLYFIIHGNENSKICSNSYSTIRIIDGSTLEIIPNMTDLTNIDSLFIDSKNNSIFAFSTFESEMKVIDGQKNIVIDSVSLDESINHENYYDEKSNLIFGHYNGTITIVNINDSLNIKKISVPNYDDQQIRLSGGNDKLFIISDDYYTSQFSVKNGFLTIWDIKNEKFSDPIKIGQKPFKYAFDPELGLLYTANLQSESISIIDIQNEHVINTVESLRFEIVSFVVLVITTVMLAIILKNRSSENLNWLIGGLCSVYGIYLPWTYPFLIRYETGVFIEFINTSVPIWPFTIVFPLSFSILYYVFLFTRFKKIRDVTSQVYYFPKKAVIEIFYDETRMSKVSFFLISIILSFLIYEMVHHLTLQDFFGTLPASEILNTFTIPNGINESPAGILFSKSPLLQIFLAGIGGFWLIVLRRFWNLEWNKILKFGELDPHDKTIFPPEMKFQGSRSLVLFIFFAFFFYLAILASSNPPEEPLPSWVRPPSFYSFIHLVFYIIPTTIVILFFERIIFTIFSRSRNREI